MTEYGIIITIIIDPYRVESDQGNYQHDITGWKKTTCYQHGIIMYHLVGAFTN